MCKAARSTSYEVEQRWYVKVDGKHGINDKEREDKEKRSRDGVGAGE